MKRVILFLVAAAAIGMLIRAATAADVQIVAQAPPLSPSPWDVAFGLAFVSDYNFRGITQSNHKPSVWAYYEPRYNITKDLQLYAGIGGESIAFPNGAAAEIDLSAGIRPTLGPVALDLGVWYYWYPGGECFHNLAAFGGEYAANGPLSINGNTVKADLNFYEIFAKSTFTLNENVAFGGAVYYSPSTRARRAPMFPATSSLRRRGRCSRRGSAHTGQRRLAIGSWERPTPSTAPRMRPALHAGDFSQTEFRIGVMRTGISVSALPRACSQSISVITTAI